MMSRFCWSLVCLLTVLSSAASDDRDDDTLCYTVNGADYEGFHNYVNESAPSSDVVPCMKWNATSQEQFRHLPENYCRNPNGSVFPWCFVEEFAKADEEGNNETRREVMRFCDIPRCNTPAYTGCYALPPSDENSTVVQLLNDPKMKIAKCLAFCRDQRFHFAGLWRGTSCRCMASLPDEESRRVPKRRCLASHCGGDPIHACGGEDALAVYDTSAGMCGGVFYGDLSGVIYSPRWPGPYQHNMSCDWAVHVPQHLTGKDQRERLAMTVDFVHFDLQPEVDVLSIHTLDSVISSSAVLVGVYHGGISNLPDLVELSLNHVGTVVFHFESDHSIQHFGFTVTFTSRFLIEFRTFVSVLKSV